MQMRIFVAAVIAVGLLMPAAADAGSKGSVVLERIDKNGVINIGHREASVPFSYIGPDGAPIGYSIEICKKIVGAIGARLERDDLKIKYVPVTSQTRIALIANGTIDLECGSTTNNLTRQKQVDYLAITFITGTKIGSKKGSGITEDRKSTRLNSSHPE